MGEIRPHIPEGYTIIFEAPQRWGKTLSGVIWALNSFQEGRNIFSNIQLGFGHEPLQFGEIELETGSTRFWNGHIFIDELNFYFDARRSLSGKNIKFSSFLLQQKKQGCYLTGTTHDLYSLDVRLRENYDFLIKPKVYPAFPKTPVVLKMVIESGPTQEPFKKVLRLDCRPYLGLYDSRTVYNPFAPAHRPKGRRVNL